MKAVLTVLCFILIAASFDVRAVTTTETSSATKETVSTSDKRAEAYFAQGYLYYLEGSYKEASPEFIKALQLKPGMIKARYWLAKTAFKQGNYKSAVNQCNAALDIAPRYKDARILRDKAQDMLAPKAASKAAPKAAVAEQKIITLETTATVTKEAATIEAVKIEPKKEVAPVKVKTEKPAAKIIKEAVKEPKKKDGLISMDLRNVDISSVLQIFSRETGISILAGKDVYGKVTVILNNVTPSDALDIILRSNGFTYARTGNVVQVYSSGEPARIEELPGGLFVRTFLINYIGPDELNDTLEKLMPEGTSIYTTKGSKAIIVKGTLSEIRRAEILIRNLDIPPRQVMVEAKIIEVSLNESQVLGANATWTNPNNATEVVQTKGLANSSTATGAIGLYYSVTNQNPQSLVSVLSTRTGFNVLSSPKVMALNEQKAEIITGSRLGYKVKTTTTTGMVESVEFLDVGTKLVITPSIKSDGLIVMDIHPEISEGAIVGDLPQKNSTETTTQLIVKDGQTIIIGGLIRETSKKEVKGVPFLMDIWLIGSLLKRTDITTEKKEVIVLITPHIVTPKLMTEMETSILDMEKQKRDSTPVMNLDLVR